MFDGQGYDWWWYVIITTIDNRPHTLTMERCSDIVLHGGLHFRNSPQYHILLMDVADVFIEDIDIPPPFAVLFQFNFDFSQISMLMSVISTIFSINTVFLPRMVYQFSHSTLMALTPLERMCSFKMSELRILMMPWQWSLKMDSTFSPTAATTSQWETAMLDLASEWQLVLFCESLGIIT